MLAMSPAVAARPQVLTATLLVSGK